MKAIYHCSPCLSSVNPVFSTFFIPTLSQTPPLMPMDRKVQKVTRLSCSVSTNSPHPKTVHHSHQELQTGVMPLLGLQGVLTTSRLCAVAKGLSWRMKCRENYSFSKHLWGPWTYSCDFLLPYGLLYCQWHNNKPWTLPCLNRLHELKREEEVEERFQRGGVREEDGIVVRDFHQGSTPHSSSLSSTLTFRRCRSILGAGILKILSNILFTPSPPIQPCSHHDKMLIKSNPLKIY